MESSTRFLLNFVDPDLRERGAGESSEPIIRETRSGRRGRHRPAYRATRHAGPHRAVHPDAGEPDALIPRPRSYLSPAVLHPQVPLGRSDPGEAPGAPSYSAYRGIRTIAAETGVAKPSETGGKGLAGVQTSVCMLLGHLPRRRRPRSALRQALDHPGAVRNAALRIVPRTLLDPAPRNSPSVWSTWS